MPMTVNTYMGIMHGGILAIALPTADGSVGFEETQLAIPRGGLVVQDWMKMHTLELTERCC